MKIHIKDLDLYRLAKRFDFKELHKALPEPYREAFYFACLRYCINMA